MDVFVEQIIAKRKTPKDLILCILISLAIPVISFVALVFLKSFAIFVFAGGCYGAWFLISGMNIEYEYSVTNGDLTIDKIIAKRKRKRVVNLDCKSIEAFGVYDPKKFANRSFDNRFIVGSHELSPGQWYATVRHKKFNHTLIVFEPEQRVLDALKPFLPKLVAIEAFKGMKGNTGGNTGDGTMS